MKIKVDDLNHNFFTIDDEKLNEHKAMIDNILKGARYFIIKSNNHENVSLSKAKVCFVLFFLFFFVRLLFSMFVCVVSLLQRTLKKADTSD